MKIHARIGLSISNTVWIGRGRQVDALPVCKPTGVSLVDETVVAVIQLQHPMIPGAYVNAQVAQRASLMTCIDVTLTAAVQRIEPVAEDPARIDFAAQIHLGRADAVARV